MRLKITLVGLLLAVSSPLTASTIKGIILDTAGQPIPNVQISAIGGAGSVPSHSNGTFVLEFPKKEPGERVQLIVQRTGMVVVNFHELGVTLPKDPDAVPLTLLLCKPAEREEMVRKYDQLDSVDTIERRYQKKVEDLQARHASEAAKEQLRVERDRERDIELEAAETLAKIKVEDVEKALAGGILPIYRSDAASAMNSLALMYRRRHRNDKARKAYDEALAVSRKLALEAPGIYLPDVIETLNNLGNLLSEQNSLPEAQKAYEEALEISPKPTQNNPAYQQGVAMTLNNLGTLFMKENRLAEAHKDFDDSLQWYRQLAQLNPDIYQPHVAETLNNLGILNRDQGILNRDQNQLVEARKSFNDALTIYEALAAKNPGQYTRDVEATRGLLESAFTATLKSYRELEKRDPSYRPNVAETLYNLGNLNLKQNRIEKAREHFSEAFGIYVTLANESFEQYGQRALQIHGTLSGMNLGQDQQEFESNRRVLEASIRRDLESRRKQAQLDPALLSNVAKALIGLGTLTRDQDRIGEARNAFGEALSIFETLARKHPPEKGATYGRYDGDVKSTRALLDDLTEIRKP